MSLTPGQGLCWEWWPQPWRTPTPPSRLFQHRSLQAPPPSLPMSAERQSVGTAPGQDLSLSLLQEGAAGVRLYKPTAGGRAEAGAATLLRAGGPSQGDTDFGERHQGSGFTRMGNPPSGVKAVPIPEAGGQEKAPAQQCHVSCNNHHEPLAPCKHPEAICPELGVPSSLGAWMQPSLGHGLPSGSTPGSPSHPGDVPRA